MVKEMGWIWLSVEKPWNQRKVLDTESNVQIAKGEKHF